MKKRQSKAHRRHTHWLRRVGSALAVCVGFVVIVAVIVGAVMTIETQWRQSALEPFYRTAGLSLTGAPGQVVRQEPLNESFAGGTGIRVLYRTQRADGSPTFSSGVVYVPDHPAAGNPVVAWAHGTLGMGDQCAPSRTAAPESSTPWVSAMLQKGWVVTASDYAGFGTPGVQGYLVGGDEAHDVLNSVRAARQVSSAGSTFVVWGHSQGGNSALFSAREASTYTPELRLAGTVASAPAAELIPLLNEEYGTAIDWVIGPLVATSWPSANQVLSVDQVLTPLGRSTYSDIADQCIIPATIGGLVRTWLGQKFFSANIADVPAWRSMAEQQSAPTLMPTQPLMVVESLNDQVVLPNTTALYIHDACKDKANLTSLWLRSASHQQIPFQSASAVIDWIGGRFGGKPTSPTCSQPLPIQPAS